MKLNEIKKLKSDKSLIKKLVHESNFSLLNIKDTYINNLYTEYAVDVKMEDNDINDKQFTQTEKAKHFRELVRKTFGTDNLREGDVVGMVLHQTKNEQVGRFVFQLKHPEKRKETAS